MYFAFKQKKDILLSLISGVAKRIIVTDYSIINIIIYILAKCLFTRFDKIDVKKVLILRSGGMGDTITALPAFTVIKRCFPEAKIDLLTNSPLSGRNSVQEFTPKDYFSSFYFYKTFVDKQIINQLKQNKYDLFIELPTYNCSLAFEIRSIMLAKIINAKSGFGWHISSTMLLRAQQEKIFEFETNRTRLLNILKYYGLKFIDPGYLLEQNNIQVSESDVEKRFMSLSSQKMIAIIPGAGREENKWPIENFKQVIKHFLTNGYSFVIIGGEKDSAVAEILCISNDVINLCGKIQPLKNALIFKKCALVIGNDTGPMHLAYASGTKVVALFSKRDYTGKWYPPEESRNAILRAKVNIQDIPVSDIINKSLKILSSN